MENRLATRRGRDSINDNIKIDALKILSMKNWHVTLGATDSCRRTLKVVVAQKRTGMPLEEEAEKVIK